MVARYLQRQSIVEADDWFKRSFFGKRQNLPDPNQRIYPPGLSICLETAVFFRRKVFVRPVIPALGSDNEIEAFNRLHPRNVYMRHTVTAFTISIHG